MTARIIKVSKSTFGEGMEIVLRAQAVVLGLKTYYTGEPCLRAHVSARYVHNYTCCECLKLSVYYSRKGDTPRQAAEKLGLKTYKPKKACHKGHSSERYTKTSRCVECAVEYVSIACERVKARLRKSLRNRKLLYSDIYRSDRAAARNYWRRVHNLRSTPLWVDGDHIKLLYLECRAMTRATGIVHHLDHVVPLNGDQVCGLTVPWNLQIIPATVNMKKGNKLIKV